MMVQRPFVTSLSLRNNWFWNHDRLFESGGQQEREGG